MQRGIKPSSYGQPQFSSHPHLLQPGEITPGISEREYEQRRKTLMDSLPEDSLVVCLGGQLKYMSGQIFYKFRQASDFWYLTGFEEPDSALILQKTSSSRGYRMVLFCSEKDLNKEKWDGPKTGFEGATSLFHADDAQSLSSFPELLKSMSTAYSHVYMDVPSSSLSRRGRSLPHKSLVKFLSPDPADPARSEYSTIIQNIISSKRKSLAPEIAKLRAVKSEAEQHLMRAAADISGHAHTKTMRFTEPGMSEHALAAHFEYLCTVKGAQRLAYVPVVASGPNALIIHYTSNNQLTNEGEMVLVDAGCEYNGYASDITRTYPVSGTFTSAQATLYTALLHTQKYLITLCTESARLSLAEIHRESCNYLRTELNKIGFNLPGSSGMADLERILYPHYVGHPIGIDLHESSHWNRAESLKAGMVVTIEPGVYVPPFPQFPVEFHDMGIRIEDEVLVGNDHATVLSVNSPKEIADIEGACQGVLDSSPF